MLDELFEFLKNVDPAVRIPENIELELHRLLLEEEIMRIDIILDRKEICDRVYFIIEGLFRCYCKVKGREEDIWFMSEGDVMFDPESFYRETSSGNIIVALEKSKVASISKKQLESLYKKSHEFEHIGRIVTEKYYLKFLLNWKRLGSGPVKDRYNHFLQAYPGLDKRIPAKYIASFIKCSVRTLYRVRQKGKK